jgi:putative FmdB family regulatory protein
MPTYEYRCKDCGHELEAQQSFSDEPLTECPSCQGTLKKKFSAVGISFKGSGFYKTDSRGSSKSASVPASSSSGDGSGSGGTSSESSTSSSDNASSTSSTSDKKASGTPATPAGGAGSKASASA